MLCFNAGFQDDMTSSSKRSSRAFVWRSQERPVTCLRWDKDILSAADKWQCSCAGVCVWHHSDTKPTTSHRYNKKQNKTQKKKNHTAPSNRLPPEQLDTPEIAQCKYILCFTVDFNFNLPYIQVSAYPNPQSHPQPAAPPPTRSSNLQPLPQPTASPAAPPPQRHLYPTEPLHLSGPL